MFRPILCLVALLLVTVCSAKPKFCRKYDCPDYNVRSRTDEYEVRCYKTYNWVTTTKESWILTTNKAFMRLFRYISGDNDKKQKIPMTVPVISKKQHKSKSVFYKANVTMSFFIPTAFQADPPVPTDDNVYIDNKSSFCVYVRSFSGWMWSGKWWNLRKLKAALKKDGLGDAYRKDYYYTAGYNSPMEWRFWERHNEIWFVKK